MTSEEPPPGAVRRERIIDLLAERPFVRVGDLSGVFGISEVTVRSDLDVLARDGRVRRVRGGAVPGPIALEHPYEEQQAELPETKNAIGKLAASLIGSGESVILDVGTTTTAAARALVERRDLPGVTAFTNGLQVALELERAGERLTVVVTGGTLRRLQHSLVGPMSTDLLRRIRANTVLLGCTGVDAEAGFSNLNLAEIEVKRAMLAAAERRIVLADGRKLGRVDLAQICPIGEADILITSSSADPDVVAALRATGLEVLIVEESDHS